MEAAAAAAAAAKDAAKKDAGALDAASDAMMQHMHHIISMHNM